VKNCQSCDEINKIEKKKNVAKMLKGSSGVRSEEGHHWLTARLRALS